MTEGGILDSLVGRCGARISRSVVLASVGGERRGDCPCSALYRSEDASPDDLTASFPGSAGGD